MLRGEGYTSERLKARRRRSTVLSLPPLFPVARPPMPVGNGQYWDYGGKFAINDYKGKSLK
jgi:hypothetical protein